jgi:uroporphyrinogen-III synthase
MVIKVLSTKKLDPLLIQESKQKGIGIVEKEMIGIKPVWNKETYDRIIGLAKTGYADIAFTSANAVEMLNRYMVAEDTGHIINWNVYCISGKTKRAVQAAGFLPDVISGEGANAAELAQVILDSHVKQLIFFCGNRRRDELPAMLRKNGVVVSEVVVYETVEQPAAVQETYDAVLFFSPSSVQSFFSANELPARTVCFAIGPTTASSLKTFTGNVIRSSVAPDPKELITEVAEYFKNR